MRIRSPRWLNNTIGVLLLVVLAELIGRTGIAGRSWPPLTEVFGYLAEPVAQATVLRALTATAASAGWGLVLGIVFAAIAALLSTFIPVLRPGLDRLASVLNAVPLIALAPLLITTVGRDSTPAVVAALGVGFVMFVAFTAGLSGASATHQDVFAVFGSARTTTLLRLQVPVALPTVLDGLALAAPTAILGATIGEWFGAPRGLGVLIVSAMQNYQVLLLWAAALTAALLSLAAYLIAVRLQSGAVRRFT